MRLSGRPPVLALEGIVDRHPAHDVSALDGGLEHSLGMGHGKLDLLLLLDRYDLSRLLGALNARRVYLEPDRYGRQTSRIYLVGPLWPSPPVVIPNPFMADLLVSVATASTGTAVSYPFPLEVGLKCPFDATMHA